ncbi:MAG: hypothetical protein IIZ39_14895, partial [Blautia sp.]|nr:hypothetical protein [Blautia sp.]
RKTPSGSVKMLMPCPRNGLYISETYARYKSREVVLSAFFFLGSFFSRVISFLSTQLSFSLSFLLTYTPHSSPTIPLYPPCSLPSIHLPALPHMSPFLILSHAFSNQLDSKVFESFLRKPIDSPHLLCYTKPTKTKEANNLSESF